MRAVHLAMVASLLACGNAAAGVSATMTDCSPRQRTCDQRINLVTQADPSVAEASIYVGVMAVVQGQPNPGVSGWYDGRRWITGRPAAAWTGRLARSQAAIPVPGGVCGLVREAGGPPGTYGVYVGWGSADRLTGGAGLDATEVRRMIANSPPEQAQRLRELLSNYEQANQRAAEYDSGGMTAFMDMRRRESFSQIKTFECQGGTQ